MSTAQSYRAFTLQALRTGPLEVAEKISEHKAIIDAAQYQIRRSVFYLVMFWSLGLSVSFAIILALVFRNIFVGLGIVVLLVAASVTLVNVRAINRKLKASKRYDVQHQQIERSNQAIAELTKNAKNYQERMEISKGPGFLATFSDVLVSPYYPSFFTLDDRMRVIGLSGSGRGGEVDIFEYAKLIFELKANGIEAYTEQGVLVDTVAPQNKYNAALAYARLITANIKNITDEEIRLLALVGYNAWLVYQAQGRPAHWENEAHLEWDTVKLILEYGFYGNAEALAGSVAEYKVLLEKWARRNS